MHTYIAFLIVLILGANLIDGKCTKNLDFEEPAKINDSTLCEAERVCTRDYLTTGTKYFGCGSGEHKGGKFAIGIIEVKDPKDGPYTVIQCFGKQGWTYTMPCVLEFLVTFQQTTLKRLQFYVVFCSWTKLASVFPNEGQSQIQIKMINDIRMYNKYLSTHEIMSTTDIIRCIPQCKESVPKYEITYRIPDHVENDIDPHDSSLLRLFYTHNSVDIPLDLHLMKYQCKSLNVESWDIAFYVGNVYEPLMINNYAGIKRLEIFDAGTEIRCAYLAFLKAKGINNQSAVPPLQTFIYITAKNENNMEINQTRVDAEKLVIPEIFNETAMYTIHCYIGVYDNRSVVKNKHRYYKETLSHPFKMGSIYQTNIIYSDDTLIENNDVEDQSFLKCNLTHYQKNMNLSSEEALLIGFLYGDNFTAPYSSMFSDSKITINISTSNSYYFIRRRTGKMAFFCVVNSIKTTPLEIISGERPFTTLYNIFPEWKHQFSLRTFIYGCVGVNVVKTSIICVNCTAEYVIFSQDSTNNSIITIPSSIRKDVVLEFLCYGNTIKYRTLNASMVLNIIAYDYNDFNDTYKFFMENDIFNCITKITIFTGNSSKYFEEPMPTTLMMDNKLISTNLTNTLLIIEPGHKLYSGCCLTYKDTKLTCDGNWKDLLVGNSYKVKWSKNLTEIYPNNEVRCFACVNYTGSNIVSCTGENKVNSYIGMEVVLPDLSVQTVSCKDKKLSVKGPSPIIKPDKKSYYKMSELKVTLVCCIRDKEYRELITMKSCNEYPPQIRIIPSDRFLFLVGESFSCTTDMEDCINGMMYVISLIKEGQNPTLHSSSSLTFTYEHVGNAVEIICIAGINVKQTDSRIVRIEQSPFNITITGLTSVMWYGRYLQCNAEGFPPPDIFWIQTNGFSTLRVSEYYLLIGPWDLSGNYTVICEAKNSRGMASKEISFANYNSRIRFYETDKLFYILVPFLTVLFVILMFLSTLLTFQEVYFGVPFFSSYKAKTMYVNPPKKRKRTPNVMI